MTLLKDIQVEKPSRFAWFWNMFRKEEQEFSHIVCTCRPQVNFCGRFEELIADTEPVDGSECPECLAVLTETGCPNCGCSLGTCCSKCHREGCPCHAQV